MNDENNDPENYLNLDLSLGFPQQRGPVKKKRRLVPREHYSVKKQGGLVPQEQDPVEEQGQFMQLLTSSDHMTSSGEFTNGTNPAQAIPPYSPPPSVSVATSPQLNQVGTVAMETPRRGRPPGGQARRNSTRAGAVERNMGDREIIPPYPWATKKPAVIHTIRDLYFKNINVISGQIHCKPCDRYQTLEYNLMEKFSELYGYIKENKEVLRQRAPVMWSTPELFPCGTCQCEMKPVISERKEEINWLFLLLGQMLGCCTLEQLKFFCELNSKHRTGAKDRVLYITYLGLCKQLDPKGPFSL